MTQRRDFTFQLKAASSGEFDGYAAAYTLDRQNDVIVTGAFSRTSAAFLKSGVILWSHDPSRVVARPLEMRETGRGLYLRAAFHSTAEAQEIRRLLQERIAEDQTFGLSIGFTIPEGGYQYRDDGVREITRVDLYEVSLVAVPANADAVVTGAKCASCAPAGSSLIAAKALAEQVILEEAKRTAHDALAAVDGPQPYSYALLRPGDMSPILASFTEVAAKWAARQLGVWDTPTVEMFVPAAKAWNAREQFTRTKDIAGEADYSRNRVRVRVDLGPRAAVKAALHEIAHLAVPMHESGDEQRIEAIADDLYPKFWASEEAHLLRRHFLSDAA